MCVKRAFPDYGFRTTEDWIFQDFFTEFYTFLQATGVQDLSENI